MFYSPPGGSASAVSVSYVPADRTRCPVCSESSGDCVGDSHYSGRMTFIEQVPDDPRATFRVPKRIYDVVEINGRKQRKLIYPMGTSITPEEAKRLGLLPK